MIGIHVRRHVRPTPRRRAGYDLSAANQPTADAPRTPSDGHMALTTSRLATIDVYADGEDDIRAVAEALRDLSESA